MKKAILVVMGCIGIVSLIFTATAFKASSEKKISYTQFTTIESVNPGGVGRSRMILSDPEGHYLDKEMDNLYTMVGVSFANIRKNDKLITDKINELTAQGWSLININTGMNDADINTAIYITRYLFRKEE